MADLLDQFGRGVGVQILVFLVASQSGQHPEMPPIFYSAGHATDDLSNFSRRQETFFPQPFIMSLNAISPAQMVDDAKGEGGSPAGTSTLLIEDLCDFPLGMLGQ